MKKINLLLITLMMCLTIISCEKEKCEPIGEYFCDACGENSAYNSNRYRIGAS